MKKFMPSEHDRGSVSGIRSVIAELQKVPFKSLNRLALIERLEHQIERQTAYWEDK